MGKTIDIQTTLDSIIFQRHQVAHAANAINLSRYELGQYIKFLKILAEMCDEELYSRICILEK